MKRMRYAILPQIHQIGRIGSICKKPTPESPLPSPLPGGTTGRWLRWLQIEGAGEAIASPNWAALLPGWASAAQPDALCLALRVTPTRLDLFDETRGWGARETVEW